MRIRSVHSRRREQIHRSAIAFIRGACGADSTTSTPIDANTASNAAVNLGVPVADQVGEVAFRIIEVGGEVSGHLRGPSAGRVGGNAE
jgi:hypothetical protein